MLERCALCGNDVVPMTSGTCPACRGVPERWESGSPAKASGSNLQEFRSEQASRAYVDTRSEVSFSTRPTCLKCKSNDGRCSTYKCYFGRRFYSSSGGWNQHRWELLGSVEGPICPSCLESGRTVIGWWLALILVVALGILFAVSDTPGDFVLGGFFLAFFGGVILFSVNAEGAALSRNYDNIGDLLVWSAHQQRITAQYGEVSAWPRKEKEKIFRA